MKRSSERILTTHTGSLPRPDDLVELLWRRDEGEPVDRAMFEARVAEAVRDCVASQLECGIDVVNDGETGRTSYFSYVCERLSGFDGDAPAPQQARLPRDLADFPRFAQTSFVGTAKGRRVRRRACTGPIACIDRQAVQHDIAVLQDAVEAGHAPADAFLSAASPGLIALFMPNTYYPTREAYLFALADAMKSEYDAIASAGLVLQLDCPDLALSWNGVFQDLTIAQFRAEIALNIAALNHATRDIPPQQMRMHVCWGNYEGPHHHDIPLERIVDLLLGARPAGLSFEGANPRHEHEYELWERVTLPDGKLLIPGVLDSTTNFIEHPQLVAQRIERFARLVGRENLIAGSDCGFGTGAGLGLVDPQIVPAKLAALVEGARLASERLWR